MKRFIAAMLAGTMIFSLAACGSQPSDGGVETTGTKQRVLQAPREQQLQQSL